MNSKITVSAIINNNIDKVWECYVNPAHICNWNFASDDWQCPHVENDLKAGGKYVARMEAKDGSFGFDFEAVYDEIISNKMIAYTITDGRKAEVIFESIDGGTVVTINFDAENQNSRELQQEGWQAILNNFKKYSESR